jgi:hypothetical protein
MTSTDCPVPYRTSRLRSLTSDDVEHLIGLSAKAASGPTAEWCLGLASPYQEHRVRAIAALETAGMPGSRKFGQAGGCPATSIADVLLLALLIRTGEVLRLVTSRHPLLPQLIAASPTLPADAIFGAPTAAQCPLPRDPRLAGCVLPCLVAVLVESRECGLAAALLSWRLRLHPAIAAVDGSVALLERYLQAACAAEAGSAEIEGSGGGLGTPHGGPDGFLSGWPAAIEHLWCTQVQRCRHALRAITTESASQG